MLTSQEEKKTVAQLGEASKGETSRRRPSYEHTQEEAERRGGEGGVERGPATG